MPDRHDIPLQEAVAEALESRLLDVHTAMPGTVLVYNPLTSTATVRPGVRRALRGQDEETVYERLPDLPEVPVLLGAGLVPGDKVLLLFCEADAQGFESSGTVSDPHDVTRHGMGSPYCVPFGPVLIIGNPITAQFVALQSQLLALKSAIAAAATTEAGAGGTGGMTALNTSLSGAGWPATGACTTLKAAP